MKAMILAAGFGRRLVPISNWLPKAIFPVLNIPTIDFNLMNLHKAGIREVVINLHHQSEQIVNYLTQKWSSVFELTFLYEPEILGTGGALKNASHVLKNETVIVCNCDVICPIDIKSMIESHQKSNAVATMLLRDFPEDRAYKESFICPDKDNRIAKIHRAKNFDELALVKKYLFTGIHVLEPEVYTKPPQSVFSNIIEKGYDVCLSQGLVVNAFYTEGLWEDVGCLRRYLDFNFWLLEDMFRLGLVQDIQQFFQSHYTYYPKNYDDNRIKGPVLIGDNCEIDADVTIGPYVIIGNDSNIEKKVHISHSILFEGSYVEPQTYLDHCVMHNKAFGICQ